MPPTLGQPRPGLIIARSKLGGVGPGHLHSIAYIMIYFLSSWPLIYDHDRGAARKPFKILVN